MDKDRKLNSADTQTVIGAGVKVEGKFDAIGDVVLKGRLTGTLDTQSALFLEEGAFIDGDMTAKNANLAGEIKGNVKVQNQVGLTKTAKIKGDLECQILSIEAGAIFNGRCSIGRQVPEKATEEGK
ncbi:MAG: polymer-forming cytoskeletal protein [Patescibacteria group bacterium]|nr:polymer-forming cytoskeletal protein [Patescibacteria group bacterium]MDD5121681.1 polymer-forming cytoskeletal protein [Patescibacteria group bacterium]MDD5222082.1 polymer-forming cytoskeletal protein [Patescibacteria group bacterium]MDD5396155.1 polymer-forming cytoskeletal protein [Patescibacteria group bacterium]